MKNKTERIENYHLKRLAHGFFCLVSMFVSVISATAQVKKTVVKTAAVRSVTVASEPNASVWVDGVKYGKTDAAGSLTIKTVAAGAHTIRVRADGFKEVLQPLPAAQKGAVKINLVKTSDEAELAFQQAENSTDKEKSADFYGQAVKLRPKYADAYIGLARVLAGLGDTDGALKAIANARKIRPADSEISAVEGRVYKENLNEEKAIASFKRALAEGKGFQPEAQAGLGLIYQERAEAAAAKGDFQQESANYAESAKFLQAGLNQLSGAPDAEIIYQLLGLIYEKTKKFNQAISVYNEFLRFFPDSSEADAVRSFIVQIKKQMSEQQ